MKTLIPMLFVVMILATGCPQPEPEVYKVEIGLFTPYAIFPEMLNGKIKEVTDRNYLASMKDGRFVKGERLSENARDTINWISDFRLTFDEGGNLLASENIDENDHLIDKQVLTVEQGRIQKAEYSKDDTLRNYTRLKYNNAGHLISMLRFRTQVDTLIWKAMLTTDENGNFLEWMFFNSKDELTGKNIFTVNLEGKRTGFTYYNADGEKTFEQKYTFENGFMIKQEMINREGEVSVSEYDYLVDDTGNWVKTIGFSDELIIITERSITYFEE